MVMDPLAEEEGDEDAPLELELDAVEDPLADDSTNNSEAVLRRAVKYYYHYLKYEVGYKHLSAECLARIQQLNIAAKNRGAQALEILGTLEDDDLNDLSLLRFGKYMFLNTKLAYKTSINYVSSIKVHLLSGRSASCVSRVVGADGRKYTQNRSKLLKLYTGRSFATKTSLVNHHPAITVKENTVINGMLFGANQYAERCLQTWDVNMIARISECDTVDLAQLVPVQDDVKNCIAVPFFRYVKVTFLVWRSMQFDYNLSHHTTIINYNRHPIFYNVQIKGGQTSGVSHNAILVRVGKLPDPCDGDRSMHINRGPPTESTVFPREG